MLEALSDPVVVFDGTGSILLGNLAWEDLDVPATFDLPVFDDAESQLTAQQLPPAHAVRGEALDRTITVEPSRGNQVRLAVRGTPIISDGQERLFVVVLRRLPALPG